MFLLISFVLLLCAIPLPASINVAELPNCANKDVNKGWVLVNTLDGKLSVLDYNNDGKEVWSMDTGPGPMLASNIDRLEMTNSGNRVRIIPALSGSLYKFNGDTIDAIPITADSLLTSSFRYINDLVIAGGKEIRTYGVIMNSGKLLYECSLEGCKNKTDYDNYEDLIILERNTKTVRAVEPRSGQERWNFSVGQLNLQFPPSSCHSDAHSINIQFNMKAVVPEGLVYAFGPTNQVIWKKQFNSPIVNVWTWNGRDMKSVNLFSDKQYSWASNSNNISPVLYIGMHNKQLYIHESVILQQLLTFGKKNKANAIAELSSESQIPWKPFPATSSALSIISNTEKPAENTNDDLEGPYQISTTALSVLYALEYVNGNGYYLYTSEAIEEQNSVVCENNKTIELINETLDEDNSDEEDTPVQVIIVSLWYWWKEVMAIAIATAFALNIINQHCLSKLRARSESSISRRLFDSHSRNDSNTTLPIYQKSVSESSDKEFISRYLTDFDLITCLGKGGFGVVFEARNKIDECSYAVKRITLPNKPESRQRVMREVKALAKLDHRNIVRYFNAWLESPPPEWIDDFDQVWNQDTLTDGLDFSTTKSPQMKKLESSVIINLSDISCKHYSTTDIKSDNDSFIVFENSCTPQSDENITESPSEPSFSVSKKPETPQKHNKGSRSHPTVYATEKVFLYIQMQLCRRESLRDWLKDNFERNPTEIKVIFEQIVAAVEYVHLKGLIHRDLKPSNIFFSIDGEVKIGDFGLVTGMEECVGEAPEMRDASNQEEIHTQAVGTQLYMSPEQLSGLSYNYKVDIYSLGVILFELLVPFQTVMERNITLCNLRKNKFPEKFCKNFHSEFHLLELMLSKSPEKRPTTIGIRARPPLGDSSDVCDDYHYELPPRH